MTKLVSLEVLVLLYRRAKAWGIHRHRCIQLRASPRLSRAWFRLIAADGKFYPSEDPCSKGGDFPIFLNPARHCQHPTITPLQFDPSLTQVTISYDMLLASLTGLPGSNAGLTFRIDSMDAGTLSLNGQSVQPGVTELSSGQSLTWTRLDLRLRAGQRISSECVGE